MSSPKSDTGLVGISVGTWEVWNKNVMILKSNFIAASKNLINHDKSILIGDVPMLIASTNDTEDKNV